MNLEKGKALPMMNEVLKYVKRSFSEDDFLDSVPLAVAGNAGAWKAWRAHRASLGLELPGLTGSEGSLDDREEWNWDGVWEQRVRKGVESSKSDPVLYGGTTGGDDVVSPRAYSHNPCQTDVMMRYTSVI